MMSGGLSISGYLLLDPVSTHDERVCVCARECGVVKEGQNSNEDSPHNKKRGIADFPRYVWFETQHRFAQRDSSYLLSIYIYEKCNNAVPCESGRRSPFSPHFSADLMLSGGRC